MTDVKARTILNEVVNKIYTGGENRAMFLISPDEELYVEVIADENNEELYTHVYITNVFGIETFSKKVPYSEIVDVINAVEDALISADNKIAA